ncbi:MAG: glucose-1-phosphate adenylyltransferase [Desulfobacterota bacterium]|nr:glucose-1-phosphate adenylyltransferase [Thermodesulfobacteriota bacterium]MDW8001659.1 glucose-1-phosphate adenylyltransferase [Deltaproteobacteria bacterium]
MRERLLYNALAFVLAGGAGERLYPLTKDRAKPAVPFGGKYRIIDFTLSNCINSGIRKIFVLPQYKSHSLLSHIRDAWSVLNPELGEFITHLSPQMRVGEDWYRGTADAVYQNLYHLEGLDVDYILILSGDHVYKMDYGPFIRYHRQKGADLTISVIETDIEEAKRFGVVEIDNEYKLRAFYEKPDKPPSIPGNPKKALVSMGIYVFKRDVLMDVVKEDASKNTSHDFGKDIIPSMIGRYKVYAYRFGQGRKKDSGYWRDIGTIDAYYKANMDLASVNPTFNLYDKTWPIRTYEGQYPPAKTVFADEEKGRAGKALDSIICSGVIISGGRVERSILSPGVRVNSYAEVKDSILFHNVNVGMRAKIRRAIIDKGVRIPEGEKIGYDLEKDRKRFFVSQEGVVVVPRGTVIK